MSLRFELVLVASTIVVGGGSGIAAETGDFDGDGRLSIADVVVSNEDGPFADGSLSGFESFACHEDWLRTPRMFRGIRSGSTFLEYLRRSVDTPRPHWIPIWSGAVSPPARAPDDRLIVSWRHAVHLGGDRAELRFRVTNFESVRAFALLIEDASGSLRPESKFDEFTAQDDWSFIVPMLASNSYAFAESSVSTPHAAYLVTGGVYAVLFGLASSRDPSLTPGDHDLVVQLRLARSTRAGDLPLRILPTSEVLFDDGTNGSPAVDGTGILEVTEDVAIGWDGGPPPLDIDSDTRTIRGPVELRVTEASGFPGDTVRVKTQLRTDVPINGFSFRLEWEGGAECADFFSRVLLRHPDGTQLVSNGPIEGYCSAGGLGRTGPHHAARFSMIGRHIDSDNFPDRPLEFFRPLGEWLDLTEIELTIPEWVAGGTQIPIDVSPFDLRPLGHDATTFGPDFGPYTRGWPCWTEFEPTEFLWNYEPVQTTAGRIEVLGDSPEGPRPEPPDLGIDWRVGTTLARPGELAAVPLFTSVETPEYSTLRIAVEIDPDLAVVESIEWMVDWDDGAAPDVARLRRGELRSPILRCDEQPAVDCPRGIPSLLWFYGDAFGVESRHTVIDANASSRHREMYPGAKLREVGRLIVRVSDDAPDGVIPIRHVTVSPEGTRFATPVASGAYLRTSPHVFVPARDAPSGELIVAASTSFQRGDANADGRVDLSDAVATLSFLFLGAGPLECFDAGDVDDSGELEISDAIYELSALFLGGPDIRPPWPNCGGDPSPDELDCIRGCL